MASNRLRGWYAPPFAMSAWSVAPRFTNTKGARRASQGVCCGGWFIRYCCTVYLRFVSAGNRSEILVCWAGALQIRPWIDMRSNIRL